MKKLNDSTWSELREIAHYCDLGKVADFVQFVATRELDHNKFYHPDETCKYSEEILIT